MMEWLDILKVSVPLLIALAGWFYSDHSKRQWEGLKRKEEKYVALLSSLKGFYTSADQLNANQEREEFIMQLSVAWLYCPDNLIRKGYHFLDQVNSDSQKSNEEKEKALREFVLCMRKDLFKMKPIFSRKTGLCASEFQLLSSNR